MATRWPPALLGLLVTVAACSSGRVISAQPSPTAAPTEHIYEATDRSWSIHYFSPWYIDQDSLSTEYVSLFNTRLSSQERAAREAAGDYDLHDGEGKIEISVGGKVNLAAAKREECRAHDATLAVRECTIVQVSGHEALWILSETEFGCMCRDMLINGSTIGLRLGGGACLNCSQTSRLLLEIETILRSLELA